MVSSITSPTSQKQMSRRTWKSQSGGGNFGNSNDSMNGSLRAFIVILVLSNLLVYQMSRIPTAGHGDEANLSLGAPAPPPPPSQGGGGATGAMLSQEAVQLVQKAVQEHYDLKKRELEQATETKQLREALEREKQKAVNAVSSAVTSVQSSTSGTGTTTTVSRSLGDLDSQSETQSCPEGLVRVGDIHVPESHSPTDRKIPKILFQTSRSRCLAPRLVNAVKAWQWDGWSYYLFDDEAMMGMLREFQEDFPHLKLVQEQCILKGTMRADLWRYLVLWKYGGVYADLDSGTGEKWDESLLAGDTDAFFTVDVAYLLSQYFFAISPRHPMMYYAVNHVLLNLLKSPDTGTTHVAHSTGPWAIHFAFTSFLRDAGVKKVNQPPFKKPENSPVKAGKFYGPAGRSVTVVGEGAKRSDDYVKREVIGYQLKLNFYDRMNMTHHRNDQKEASGTPCLNALYRGYLLEGQGQQQGQQQGQDEAAAAAPAPAVQRP